MATKLNFPSADQDVFIRGDDAAARTITIGQQGTFKDRVVIDSENFAVTTLGVGRCEGQWNFNNNLSSPVSGATNTERFGQGAGNSITTAFGITALGNSAGKNISTGANNVCIGYESGTGLSTAAQCIAIGNFSMNAANTNNQVAIGYSAMRYSNGTNNLAIGSQALLGNQTTVHTGQYNTAIGVSALLNIEGNTWNNTAIGGESLENLTTGVGNTCIGRNTGNLITSGGSNIFIGNSTGDTTTTGSSNILIGSGLDTTAATTTGELRIHYSGGSNIPILSGDMVSGLLGVNTLAKRSATLNITTDSTDAVDTLLLDQDDDSETLLAVEATSAASTVNPLSSYTTGNSIVGFMKMKVNGTVRYVPFYTAPTS